MTRFWFIVCLVFAATYVGIFIAIDLRQPKNVVAYTVTVVLQGVVWAICFRPQLEHGLMSLAAIFALVTIQAIGRWFVGYMQSLDAH
jgi:hypothetical protein